MALESTQPLTEMSTSVFPGGKGGWCVRLATLPPYCAVVMKSGNLNFLEHSGPLQACNRTALSFYILTIISNSPCRKIISKFHLMQSTHNNVRRTSGKGEQFFQCGNNALEAVYKLTMCGSERSKFGVQRKQQEEFRGSESL